MLGKVIILCAPSGSGKTTLAKHLLSNELFNLKFSVSSTTRKKREGEIDGKDYYFLSLNEFKNKFDNDDQVIELLDDISKDLFNYDLEFRIQELESRFSKDMSETTFNELKELKNERKIN